VRASFHGLERRGFLNGRICRQPLASSRPETVLVALIESTHSKTLAPRDPTSKPDARTVSRKHRILVSPPRLHSNAWREPPLVDFVQLPEHSNHSGGEGGLPRSVISELSEIILTASMVDEGW
jgi:hypothetical protein